MTVRLDPRKLPPWTYLRFCSDKEGVVVPCLIGSYCTGEAALLFVVGRAFVALPDLLVADEGKLMTLGLLIGFLRLSPSKW